MARLISGVPPVETMAVKYVRFLVLSGVVGAAVAVIHLTSGNGTFSAKDIAVAAGSAFVVSLAEALYQLKGVFTTPPDAVTPAIPAPAPDSAPPPAPAK